MKKFWLFLLGLLVLATIAVWLAILTFEDNKLKLVACNVGQGDAILATWKSYQILIDGGPDNSVLSCLGKYMPFWDRTIEVVVNTHPQLDHFGGLVEVVRRYKVEVFVSNGFDSGSQGWEVLEKEVGGREMRVVRGRGGTAISTGLMRLEIVYPSVEPPADRLVTGEGKSNNLNVLGATATKDDPNLYSVIANLSFGEFDALLTGDMDAKTTGQILATGKIRDIEYLKIPHHGSRNGLTKELIDASLPEIGVISAGAKNRYGHPHPEVLQMLKEGGVKILGTYLGGDVVVTTDGNSWYVSSKDIQ